MSLTYLRKSDVLTGINSFVSSLFVYFLLSHISVNQTISVALSIFMFALIFGLTRYYSKSYDYNNYIQNGKSILRVTSEMDIDNNDENQEDDSTISRVLFSVIFAILIIISLFNDNLNSSIFISWNDIDVAGLIQLGVGIALSFFFPGYALLLIVSKFYNIRPILRYLLAYLFSMLITGLTAYISSSYLDFSTSNIKTSIIIVNLTLLVAFLFCYRANMIRFSTNIQHTYKFVPRLIAKFWTTLKTNGSVMLVFASLLGLLIVSTFYLYGGTTIGDQWYHQGRALLFMSGSFREAAFSGGEIFYPPFQSTLLAAATSLSGVPLTNTYASIAFLNVTPIIAFYYFFSRWVPQNLNRASLLACSLFAVSSGFNWIYFLGPMVEPIFSEYSFLEAIYRVGSVVVVQPTNFIFAANPEFSTGLIYIALPAGFVLLGLVRERIGGKVMYTILITGVTIVGSLAHPEFYFFIIVGSLLAVFFTFKKAVNCLHLGFVFALAFVFAFDKFFPGNASVDIFGLPLILLSMFFLLCTWGVYMSRQILGKTLKRVPFTVKEFLSKLTKRSIRWRFLIGVLVVSGVMYIYGFSLITLTQFSIDDLKIQTAGYNVPWFFYPIKLGIIGGLGLAFILSYLFKTFEKEIFAFGLIIVVALFAGPFYDEHRFSKYVMVGMIGFASLLLYIILNLRYYNKGLVNAFIIPGVIICASISVLLFIGYNSLVVQNHDYSHNPKKNFPSLSEIRLFDTLRSKIDFDSNKFNVLSLPNEYEIGHLITRLQAFSGIPSEILSRSPLTLNGSTLDSFYYLLDHSDAKYIVMPKSSIKDGTSLSKPAGFALGYFPIAYEDDNYTVLDVPAIKGPSTSFTKVGLLYDKEDDLMSPSKPITKELEFDNRISPLNNRFANTKENVHDKATILIGSNLDKGVTLWSKKIESENLVNYIEAKFRIISENKSRSNDVRLKWLQGDTEYYVSFSKGGIELFRQSKNQSDKTSLSKNMEIEKKDHFWYTIRIESLPNTINIYVNNVPKIHVSRSIIGNNTEGITRAGFTSYFNDIEIAPINIGSITEDVQKTDNQIKYYNFYFPINLFALSKIGYDTFSKDDLSALSKNLVVTSDTEFDDLIFDKYLSYIRTGGRVLVINSYDNYNGTFSKLFLIQSNGNDTEKFTNIANSKNESMIINVEGMVKSSQAVMSPDINIIASYKNSNNQTIAPFAVEKLFPGGGKIIMINAKSYFNAISDYPKKYYLTLSNISKLLNLDMGGADGLQDMSGHPKSFVGRMNLSGTVTLNSSSLSLLSLPDKINSRPVINTSRITIFDNVNDSNTTYNNVRIKDIKMGGNYSAFIHVNGSMELPGSESTHGYLNFLLQNKDSVNMRLHFPSNRFSFMEISIQNGSLTNTIRINNGSVVDLYGVESASPLEPISLLLKNPRITVNGNTSIENSNFDGYLTGSGKLNTGNPFNMEGQLKAKFDFIDHYHLPGINDTRINYISYLQDIMTSGNIHKYQTLVKVPGDIPYEGNEIPWKNILTSASNIILLTLLIIATVIISWRLWPKIKYGAHRV